MGHSNWKRPRPARRTHSNRRSDLSPRQVQRGHRRHHPERPDPDRHGDELRELRGSTDKPQWRDRRRQHRGAPVKARTAHPRRGHRVRGQHGNRSPGHPTADKPGPGPLGLHGSRTGRPFPRGSLKRRPDISQRSVGFRRQPGKPRRPGGGDQGGTSSSHCRATQPTPPPTCFGSSDRNSVQDKRWKSRSKETGPSSTWR